jgi:hypothetical protein
MGLYSEWQALCQRKMEENELKEFWDTYFEAEKQNYIKILSDTDKVFEGKVVLDLKELSVKDIAMSMNTTISHIKKIVNKKEQFTPEDLNTYLKSSELHFWEFAIAAIPLNHLSEKAKNRVLLCKKISSHLNKKKW